ncbi:MAG: AraC family transcriptional regulator [Solobacterium sp.]|nr:AraC family transcriptional regulator [Solobacterium sp.]
MFEKYRFYHFEFSESGTGLPENTVSETDLQLNRNQYNDIVKGDYQLRGYVDVLPVFPSKEDVWHQLLHMQSFSHMYSSEGYFTKRQSADSYLLVYTQTGKGKLLYEDRQYDIEPGDVFWIDCHKPHYYAAYNNDWEHSDLHLNGTLMSAFYEDFFYEGNIVIRKQSLSAFLADLDYLIERYTTPNSHRSLLVYHAIESLLTNLIADSMNQHMQIYRNISNSDDNNLYALLEKAVNYIQEHYMEPVSLEDLSSLVNISKYHLIREFKKMTGFPPNEYLIRLRIEQAKFLLVNTSLSVRKTGEMVGISNEAYFSRLFHKRTGMTAEAYRKKQSG